MSRIENMFERILVLVGLGKRTFFIQNEWNDYEAL
jgi:hypothetical protein